MMRDNSWNNVELRDNRYNQIIHMVSAAKGAEEFYSTEVRFTYKCVPEADWLSFFRTTIAVRKAWSWPASWTRRPPTPGWATLTSTSSTTRPTSRARLGGCWSPYATRSASTPATVCWRTRANTSTWYARCRTSAASRPSRTSRWCTTICSPTRPTKCGCANADRKVRGRSDIYRSTILSILFTYVCSLVFEQLLNLSCTVFLRKYTEFGSSTGLIYLFTNWTSTNKTILS